MSRAALLPTVGDPFVLAYWLSFYNKIWQHEVDRLYVRLSRFPWVPQEAYDFTQSLLNQTPKCTWSEAPMENHGPALTHLVNQCEEDYVVFVEEDSFVFKPNHLAPQFERIESGAIDIVGSPRLSCSQIIWDRTKERYDLSMQLHTDYDQGPNWWPNLFFAKKADLLRTDMNFGSRVWDIGQQIEELGITVTPEIGALAGDTMVWMSIQLRALGLRSEGICQYHSYPLDLELHQSRQHLWNGHCPWVHIGSLSTTVVGGAGECLFAEPEAFVRYLQQLRNTCDADAHSAPSTRRELRRRFAWIQVILESAWQFTHSISTWRDRYQHNLKQATPQLGLDPAYMAQLQAAWREFLPW